MELLTLCRSCMVEVASWELQNFDNNNVEMFTFCTNIEVSKDDKLPKQFCCDCKIKLKSCYTFIKKAQEVNEKLNNIISWEDPGVIDKSDNLENPLKDNESNSLHDFDFNSDVQMDEIIESNFTSNSNKNLEIKVEIENYSSKLGSPENPEIEETLTNTETDLPEMKPNLNIEDFDTHLDRISKDTKKVQKISVKKKYLRRNVRRKKNKGKQTKVPGLGRKRCNMRTRSRKSRALKTSAKRKEQSIDEKIQFKCNYCKMSYKFDKALQKHLRTKHSEDMLKTRKGTFKCNFCKVTYKFDKGLQKHISRKHAEALLLAAVTVKSENLADNLQDNNLSNLCFSSDVKMEENHENMCTSDANQSLENKMELGIHHSSPENSENAIEESLSNKELDLPEMKLESHLDDSDTYLDMDRISNDNDQKNVQKTGVKKKDSNCTIKPKRIRTKPKGPRTHGGRKYKCNMCNDHSYTHLTGLYYHHHIKHPESSKMTGEESTVTKEGEEKEVNPNTELPMGQKEMPELQEERPEEVHEKKEVKPKIPWTCVICGQTYLYTFMMCNHYKKYHLDVDNQYTCQHCPTSFSNDDWRGFHKHVQTHVESMQFACGECDARFIFGKQLAAHALAQEHSRPHVCATCGMAFETKSAMTSHTQSHTENIAPFLCFICGQSCKARASFATHIQAHSDSRPHACTLCPFRSEYMSSMSLHMKRHKGERKYSCEYCAKCFYDKYAVKKHIRQVHTRERPYQCAYCPLAASVHSELTRHMMRRHHIAREDIPRRHVKFNYTGTLRPKKPPKKKGKRGRPKLFPTDDEISEPAPQPSTSGE